MTTALVDPAAVQFPGLATRLWDALAEPAVSRALWLANVALVVGAVIAGHATHGNDAETYLGLADGLLRGVYSYWHFLPSPPADTLRSPGYPAFLAVLRLASESTLLIKLAQATLHLATVWLAADAVRILVRDRRGATLALALSALCAQQAALVALVMAEIPTAFLLTSLLRIELIPSPSRPFALLRGLLWGLATQFRSAFVLLPAVAACVDAYRGELRHRRTWTSLATCALTLLPYSAWNLAHHGELRPIPLQAGAGIFYLGYWHHRLPGELVAEPWPGRFTREWPSLLIAAPAGTARARYESEWDAMLRACDPALSPADRSRAEAMKAHASRTSFFATHEAAYTRCRERELLAALVRNVQDTPGYYLADRLFSLPRLLVSGFDLDRWEAATGPREQILVAAPFVVSASWTALTMGLLGWAFLLHRAVLGGVGPAATLFLYGWLIHAPVAVQARYVAPVRPALVVLGAAAAHVILRHRLALATTRAHQ